MIRDVSLTTRPVVIIGAGRSGTNMLRDVLTRLDGVATWPCDEINYIWRHGNREHPTDEFTPEMATHSVRADIRRRFNAMARTANFRNAEDNQRILLEKTCANSLRVPFVDTIIPEARYLYLVRNGHDVVASAGKRWKAPLDLGYIASKARYVPISDLSYYGSRYLANRLSKLRSAEAQLSVWGPSFEDMQSIAADNSLDVVCAAQWSRCVERSDAAFSAIEPSRVYRLRYEDFVRAPVTAVAGIVDFLSLKHEASAIESACSVVRTASIGKGSQDTTGEMRKLNQWMLPMLERHGYA